MHNCQILRPHVWLVPMSAFVRFILLFTWWNTRKRCARLDSLTVHPYGMLLFPFSFCERWEEVDRRGNFILSEKQKLQVKTTRVNVVQLVHVLLLPLSNIKRKTWIYCLLNEIIQQSMTIEFMLMYSWYNFHTTWFYQWASNIMQGIIGTSTGYQIQVSHVMCTTIP